MKAQDRLRIKVLLLVDIVNTHRPLQLATVWPVLKRHMIPLFMLAAGLSGTLLVHNAVRQEQDARSHIVFFK